MIPFISMSTIDLLFPLKLSRHSNLKLIIRMTLGKEREKMKLSRGKIVMQLIANKMLKFLQKTEV